MITRAQCVPMFTEGLRVYHQESEAPTWTAARWDKRSNPNWIRVCKQIPGYREYKVTRYRQMGVPVVFD